MKTIYISDDYLSLGSDATQDDLDRYAENLATHLTQRFGREVAVDQRLGGSRVGSDDRDEIEEYVHDLEAGDGWADLID